MNAPDLFWAVFAAVLGANLLTVCFVWCCVNINRREQRKEPLSTYLGGFVMVLAFFMGGFYIAMGGS